MPFSSDTGDGGWKVAAYTAQFGNGVSGTLSIEEPGRQDVVNASIATNAYPLGALPTADQGKVIWPDVVANLRVDWAWGSAQIMGAIHEVGGGYYGTTVGGGTCPQGLAGTFGNTCSGHPDEKIGFAIGAGVKINFPMIGPGDYFQGQVNYTEGASRYAALTPSGSVGTPYAFGNGNGAGSSLGLGIIQDATYCGAFAGAAATASCTSSSLQLTTVWGVNASYEHFWTLSLRTSLVGAYNDVSYNSSASRQMCGNMNGAGGANTITGLAVGGVLLAGATCDGAFDWSYWSVSSRTQWNITKDFYVGLEGYYGHINTMSKGATVTYTAAAAGAQPTALRTLNDQDVFIYRMRVHRDLVP